LGVWKFVESRHFPFAASDRIEDPFVGNIVLPFRTADVSGFSFTTLGCFGAPVSSVTLGALTVESRGGIGRRRGKTCARRINQPAGDYRRASGKKS